MWQTKHFDKQERVRPGVINTEFCPSQLMKTLETKRREEKKQEARRPFLKRTKIEKRIFRIQSKPEMHIQASSYNIFAINAKE